MIIPSASPQTSRAGQPRGVKVVSFGGSLCPNPVYAGLVDWDKRGMWVYYCAGRGPWSTSASRSAFRPVDCDASGWGLGLRDDPAGRQRASSRARQSIDLSRRFSRARSVPDRTVIKGESRSLTGTPHGR